jgi:DNA-binding transcriptional ArsR family regulator
LRKRSSGQAPATVFEIWQAGGRLLSIDSPVRLKILRHLEQGPRTLNELVAATHKSKPTLSSLHMPPLLKAGLVGEAPDPRDSRVKWYRLLGSRLGASSAEPEELKEAVVGYAQGKGLLPLRSLLEALDLDSLVASKDPSYVDGVAKRLGKMIGAMLVGVNEDARVREINRILEQERLGKLELHQGKPRVKPTKAAATEFWARVVDVALSTNVRA